MRALKLIICLFLLVLLGCGNNLSQTSKSNTNSSKQYLGRLEDFNTTLIYKGPSPQAWEKETLPPNTKEVYYQSGDLSLKAWLYKPPNNKPLYPALLYLHGGFAFSAGDLMNCKPFIKVGYVVMCPMFRGENGNPGNFELMLGEVDDAMAAVQWLANQPYIDQNRIYAFGHSAGGGIAALLSLRTDVRIQHSGSCGGLFDENVFYGWKDFVPFDLSIKNERNLRVLIGNISEMQSLHYAYIGRSDIFRKQIRAAKREINRLSKEPKLITYMIDGDHFSSLRPAMEKYRLLIEGENPNKKNAAD